MGGPLCRAGQGRAVQKGWIIQTVQLERVTDPLQRIEAVHMDSCSLDGKKEQDRVLKG